MTLQSTKTLNNGVEIPRLGLGVFQARDGEETATAVEAALGVGYRHIDTAAVYGNEEGVALGLRRAGVPRREVFLTTKLWNDDQRAGRQLAAFEESLRRLDTDYIDLYLIHWPVAGRIRESWRVLEGLYREGRVRAIGVSNFHGRHLEELMEEADVVPAVDQLECHPRLTQRPLRGECARRHIAFEAWSPLGGGGAGNLTRDETLMEIGARHGKSAAQVILRWQLQSDIITIPKSVHADRIAQNAELFDFSLSPQEMETIEAMNQNLRSGPDPEHFSF